MHSGGIDAWKHTHDFLPSRTAHRERRTRVVVGLTLVTMVVEIAAGSWFGSMALLADGWHMASHAAAIGAAALAYVFARRHAKDPEYTFGTGKMLPLAGFGSAIALGVVALTMGAESLERLVGGETVRAFDEAIVVAVVGLVVNLASAWLLHAGEDYHHHGEHAHEHGEHAHDDHNLRSAYAHVLADALTSVLAIVALVAGKTLGWTFMDPVMGLVGTVVIGRWAYGLAKESGSVLLDRDPDRHVERIRAALEADGATRVADLHVWPVGPGRQAVIASVVAHAPRPATSYREAIQTAGPFAHVTVEVNRCGPAEDAGDKEPTKQGPLTEP